MRNHLLIGAAALALFACSKEPAPQSAPETTANTATEAGAGERLDAVLAAQPDDAKARYPHRHPKETLEFFGVEPGMTVVDTLPGEVWYTGLLLDYLGPEGKVIAADYGADMWKLFGEYAPKPEEKANWPADFVAKAEGWRDEDDAAITAIQYGAIPDDMAGTADVVLVIRALHHFMRLEDEGGYMTKALADMNKILKPGGVVGVVQHRAREKSPDAWASGDSGYVKQSAVIIAFKNAGFELVGSSEINANAKDQPTDKEFVWRLPPTLATSQDNPELKAKMEAIGESDRMTLTFRKPA
ncbi:MAG: class I SAM-dependent methyltransferase [Steroidobacter sp.]